MSKLTNAEKDKLDNTCGNLRVTKLGTHVKTLEDFVNEGVLDTRANTVVEAINELYGMIVNKDCEGITIPPPGFFTLFGNDEDGKLYVYYNNADYPPQFRHVETPGELEGTLYLYIADPLGENHYELEVGHYIAVRHLDNYYTKAQINSMFTVTVEKQTTAESGSFATYVVKQGGNQVGAKINIPKDYLVKSCSVKSCTTANVPVQGYKVGDKYIDWVINTRDGSANNEHLYLLVNEIAEPYKPDNSTITMSSGNVFSVKDGGITLVKLAPAVQNLINSKADANHAHGNITKEGKVGTTPNVPLITGTDGVVQAGSFGSGANNFARGNHGHSDLASIAYVDNQIASVEGDVVIDLESKADRDHTHYLKDLKNTGTITGTDDLNDYATQGRYTCSATNSQTVGNVPFKNIAFILEVILYNSTTPCQLIHTVATDKNIQQSWYRVRNSNNLWAEWKQLGGVTRIYQKINPYDESSDYNDLNRYTEQGTYICWNSADASKIGNTPSNIAFSLIVLPTAYNGVSSYYGCTQIVKESSVSGDSPNKIWTRNYYLNGSGTETWTDWDCVSYEGHTHEKSDITDFPTSMTPTSHIHGNISNAGAIGSTANLPIITTTSGKLTTGSFGTDAKTFAEGNHEHRFGSITSGNIDTLLGDGVYSISKTNISAGNITGDLPPTSRTGGVRSFLLESRKFDSNSSIQFAYMLTTTENYNRVFYRSRTSGEWDTWRELVQISDIDSINTALGDKANSNHTHGNLQNNGQVGSTVQASKNVVTDANGKITTENKPSIPTKTSQLTNDGDGTNVFVKNNDSRITNAVKSACKIGFSTSSSAPGDAMNLSVAKGNLLYAFVRDANGNVPTGLAGGAFLFNGSPRSVTINSNGIMSLNMNTAGTFVIHAIVSDGDGYQVAAGFCRITVS